MPELNAALNTLSAILLSAGYLFIRRKNAPWHKICMLGATASSTVFLACYLYYHWHHGSTRFQGVGVIRAVYFTILTTHTILAAVQVPMILATLRFALTGKLDKHRVLARITLPIWLYVSVTGVVIYWMLYRTTYPPAIS